MTVSVAGQMIPWIDGTCTGRELTSENLEAKVTRFRSMGKKATALAALLEAEGFAKAVIPAAQWARLPSATASEFMQLYRALGGVQSDPCFEPDDWDFAYEGNLVVELDEHAHFNRYRRFTLNFAVPERLPWTEDYIQYCDSYERRSPRHGTWWSNKSCDEMFGPPEGSNDPMATATRWKQRAFYDAVKDAYCLSEGLRLVRISVYDRVNGVKVDRGLDPSKKSKLDISALLSHLESRSI